MKKLIWTIIVLMLMTSQVSAWEHKMWIDENGVTNIEGYPTNEGELEKVRLVEIRNQKLNELYAKERQEASYVRWLIETRNTQNEG